MYYWMTPISHCITFLDYEKYNTSNNLLPTSCPELLDWTRQRSLLRFWWYAWCGYNNLCMFMTLNYIKCISVWVGLSWIQSFSIWFRSYQNMGRNVIGYISQLFLMLVVLSWTSYLGSVCHNFLICKWASESTHLCGLFQRRKCM